MIPENKNLPFLQRRQRTGKRRTLSLQIRRITSRLALAGDNEFFQGDGHCFNNPPQEHRPHPPGHKIPDNKSIENKCAAK